VVTGPELGEVLQREQVIEGSLVLGYDDWRQSINYTAKTTRVGRLSRNTDVYQEAVLEKLGSRCLRGGETGEEGKGVRKSQRLDKNKQTHESLYGWGI